MIGEEYASLVRLLAKFEELDSANCQLGTPVILGAGIGRPIHIDLQNPAANTWKQVQAIATEVACSRGWQVDQITMDSGSFSASVLLPGTIHSAHVSVPFSLGASVLKAYLILRADPEVPQAHHYYEQPTP